MQNKKYLSMLGLARRAGRISMGHDMAMKSLKARKARLLIFSSDISPRLVEEFKRARSRYANGIVCLRINETMEDIHKALGYKAGVLTVDDKDFAQKINELINQEGNAYGN